MFFSGSRRDGIGNWSGRFARSANSKIGAPYGTGLIVGDALADTFLGHWLNKIFSEWPRRTFNALIANPADFICSELAAYALSQQPEYRNRGCLRGPLNAIDPQDLFEDAVLFKDWVRASGHGPELRKL